jgi:hypothetical protein
MTNTGRFVAIVVGDNPQKLMDNYSNNKVVEPYVLYRFKDRDKLYEKELKVYEELMKVIKDKSSNNYRMAKEMYDSYKQMGAFDFYNTLIEDNTVDAETGNIISTKNPDGRYDTANVGQFFSLPLINVEGKEVYSERKGNVDWSRIHLSNPQAYEFAWDSVMEGKEPKTDAEKQIYNNMKNRVEYFKAYGDRENYVASNTSFWGYAFVSEKTGWVELEDNLNQFKWVREFYNRFIVPLDDKELITVYECYRAQ